MANKIPTADPNPAATDDVPPMTFQSAGSPTELMPDDIGADAFKEDFNLSPRGPHIYQKPIPQEMFGGKRASAAQPVQVADASGSTDLDWLTNAENLDDSYRQARANKEEDEALSWLGGDMANEQPTPGAAAETIPEDVTAGLIDPVMRDLIGGAFGEMGKWAVGGPMKAVNATLGLVDEALKAGHALDEYMTGQPSLLLSTPKIPNIGEMQDKPDTNTATFLQAATQFLTGFVAGGAVLGVPKAGASLGATATSTFGRAAFADFAAFDAHEKNLADLVELYPPMKNVVTDFLTEKEESPELLGRLKNVVANSPLNVPFEALLIPLRAMKAARLAKAKSGQSTYSEMAQALEDGTIGAHNADKAEPDIRIREYLGDFQGAATAKDRRALEKRAAQMVPDDVELGVPTEYAAESMLRTATEGEWQPPPDLADAIAKAEAMPGPKPTGNPFADSVLARGPVKLEQIDIDNVMRAAAVRLRNSEKPAAEWAQTNVDMQVLSEKFGTENALDLVYASLHSADQARAKGETVGRASIEIPEFLKNTFGDKSVTPPPAPGSKTLGGSDLPAGATGQTPVNWNRIETTDDVKSMLGQMIDSFPDDMKTGGKMSFASMADQANNENAWGLLLGERATPLTNASETLALRKLWTSSGQKLKELAVEAQSGDLAAGFAFRRMIAIHRTIQATVKDIRTEQARALAQWRIPAGGSAEQMKMLDEIIKQNGGAESTKALAEAVADLAMRPGGLAKIDKLAEKGWTVKSVETAIEAWKAALLWGPHTHMVNMLSNAVVVPLALGERRLAAHIAEFTDPIAGVKFGEAALMAQGMRDNFAESLRVFGHAWRTEEQLFGQPFKAADKAGSLGKPNAQATGATRAENPFVRRMSSEYWGIGNDTMGGKALDMLGAGWTGSFRALGAADAMFKHLYYGGELKAAAGRRAIEAQMMGKIGPSPKDVEAYIAKLMDNPTEALRMEAKEFAEYNTFTNDPGAMINAINRVRNGGDGGGMVDNVALRAVTHVILPFLNTPANITRYTFERTPIAPLMSRYKAEMAAGGARRDLALARLGLGTMIMGVSYDLAVNGWLTGSGPDSKDWAKRRTMTEGGWRPHSIRVPDGVRADGSPAWRYYPINRLDPVGSILLLSAEMAEVARHQDYDPSPEWEEEFAAVSLAAAEVFKNKTYLTGLSNLLEAMNNPAGFGESYLTRMAVGMVPNISGSAAKAMDPVMRHTWDLMSSLKAKTPGLSKDLPPRLDFWGNEMTYESGLGGWYDVLSPIYTKSTKKTSAVEDEFFKIGYYPAHKKSIRIAGSDGSRKLDISLRNHPQAFNDLITKTSATSARELASYAEQTGAFHLKSGRPNSDLRKIQAFEGATLKEALSEMVVGRGPLGMEYLTADEDTKKKMMQDTIGAFRKVATMWVLDNHPELQKMRDRMDLNAKRGQASPFTDGEQ